MKPNAQRVSQRRSLAAEQAESPGDASDDAAALGLNAAAGFSAVDSVERLRDFEPASQLGCNDH
jgi:hypothetical protein